jgi:hypothetical protein
LRQAEKEEQATKEVVVVAAPLKTESEFTSQPTEVWGNEMAAEPVSHSWAEDVPAPAPVASTTAPPVTYNTSDDWAAQVGVSFDRMILSVES